MALPTLKLPSLKGIGIIGTNKTTTPVVVPQGKVGIGETLKYLPSEISKTFKEGTWMPSPLKKATDVLFPSNQPMAEKIALSVPIGEMKIVGGVGEELIKTATQKIISALKEATSVRAKQETIYTAERGAKLATGLKVEAIIGGGEKGFTAKLGALKGELTKVDFTPIREKISTQDIDNLYNGIKNSTLNEWDKITAGSGLGKLLGHYGTTLPTEGELSLLKEVFPKEFIKTVSDMKPLLQKAGTVIGELTNIPRSIMASFDLSAPFRQGLFTIGRKQFWTSFDDMFKAFGSEKAWRGIQEEIAQRPTFGLMKEAKLALTDVKSVLTQREETFMSSWAEKIPLAGKVVRASSRAYVGFLNKLRADVFDNLVENATKLGKNPAGNMDLTKQIANYVNSATGRGSVGGLEKAMVTFNGILFSPRLAVSRLDLLTKTLRPSFYTTLDPFIRKEYLKDLLRLGAISTTILGLAKLGGADVGTERNSSDYGKIIKGNTRIDTWGGFQQYIRMASQLQSGKYVSSTTGKETTLGEGYKPLTRWDIFWRQIESKEAPIISFATDLLKGQDYTGQDINIVQRTAQMFIPMVIGDMYDIAKEDPKLLPISALGIFGVGLQTYQPLTSKSPKGYPSLKAESSAIPSLKGIGTFK